MNIITSSLIRKPRTFLYYYLFLWLFIALLHFWLLIFYINVPIVDALIDSLLFYGSYMILGIGVGYVVSFYDADGEPTYKIFLYHLFAGIFMVSLWLHICFQLIRFFFAGSIYLVKVEQSMPGRILEGIFIYTILALYFYVIIYYSNFKEKIKKEADLMTLIREAELKALKSQINPHFLFNSLNSISSLTITDPEKAQEMVINLSTFLRYSLQHDKNALVPLNTELENIKLYLGIEKVRFGNKLNPIFEVQDGSEICALPNMILQPLFENAIKYGVYETTDSVTIHVKCWVCRGYLNVVVSNDFDPETTNRKGEGIGLKNIRNRLNLIYDSENLMVISSSDRIFSVQLMIPQHNQ
ncbi:MAG: histidine kinase [Bacteroidota bacterium]|nr:histidine kinase [Bacteroidota bacterium]MDP4204872.1 histidine kinase [Bacteroidota bacterium]